MPPRIDRKDQTARSVAFNFPPGIEVDAKITIEVHQVHGRGGRVESHVLLYSSEDDKKYKQLVGQMAKTSSLIMGNGFADGKDETETPQALTNQLDVLKAMVRSLHHEQGQRVTFALLGKAKKEIFTKEREMRELPVGKQQVLEEILRWHIEEAINTPLIQTPWPRPGSKK